MKRFVLNVIFFFATLSIFAQVKFESSLTEAFKLAKEQNKIVFVDYYNSECSVCKHLSELFDTDTIVANYYNKYLSLYIYPYDKVTGCLFVSLCVPKDVDHW